MEKVKLDKLHNGQLSIAEGIRDNRFVLIRCGRRFGKTTLLERTALKRAVNGELIGWFGPQYRLNTPTYNRILKKGRPQITRKSKIDQILEFRSGGAIEFWTLNDEDAGRSRKYNLAILDEASLVEKGLRDTWEQAIAPTLLDYGGSAIMAGTPKGIDPENYFYEASANPELGWVEYHAPTSANPILDAEAVARLKDEYPPLVYQQEYLAEFVDWNGAAFFSEESLLVDGQPVDIDWKPDQIFATIDTASKDGAQHDGAGVVFWAMSKHSGIPLVILDWDVTQIKASLLTQWIPGILERLEQYAHDLGSRQGSLGAWVEDKDSGIALIQSSQAAGLPVEAIDSKLTAIGKEGRAIVAAPHVYQGKVKINRYAYDKTVEYRQQTANHLIRQVCGFRMGQTKNEHKKDLLDTFTYGPCIALGNSDGW